MSMEAKAKPERVEVGQRWGGLWPPAPMVHATVISPSDDPTYKSWGGWWRVRRDDGTETHWGIENSTDPARFTFLGYDLGSPPVAGVAMEANAWGTPKFCLVCGGDKGNRAYCCETCVPRDYRGPSKYTDLCTAWDSGARDFPRPALTTAPTVAPAKVSCVDCADDITERVKAAVVGGGWRCVPCNGEFQARVIMAKCKPAPVVTSKPVRDDPYDRRRFAAEMRASDGTPQTALQHIQARQPPEPWRPSCDDDHWLPDAGTSYSSSGRGRP